MVELTRLLRDGLDGDRLKAVRGGRRKTLKIAATWPWATAVITAWNRIQALPYPT